MIKRLYRVIAILIVVTDLPYYLGKEIRVFSDVPANAPIPFLWFAGAFIIIFTTIIVGSIIGVVIYIKDGENFW